MIQNGLGECDKMVNDLRDEMNDAAEIIKRKRMLLAGAIYLSNVVLMPRALYRLKLSNATDEQIDRIQSGLRRTIASKAHITAANSSILFGGYMGCGWKRWKDEVGIERLKIVQAAWQEKKSVFSKVVRGAVWCAQKSSVASGLVFETQFVDYGTPEVEDSWIGRL